MRIAYVVNSLEAGGTTAPLPTLFDIMRAHGMEVKLFALERRGGNGLASVEASDADWAVCHPRRGHLATARWLGAEIDRWTPDLVWTSLTRATLLGQMVARRRGLPVVSWQHNLYLKPANRRLLRAARRRSALWVADSAVVADMARQRLRIDRARLVIWPIFRADPAVRADPAADLPLRLASLGRLHNAKGYDLLIAAMGRIEREGVPDYHVRIGGAGPRERTLGRLAARHGVAHRVAFVGHVDAAALLSGSDAYLQPSRREGFGIAAHEAMAAGLPLLASDTGQMALSVRESGGGVLCSVGDVGSLAIALEQLLERRDDWPAMGEANRDFALRTYGPDAFAAAGDAVMERVKALVA